MKCILVKNIDGWIFLLEALKEHYRDGEDRRKKQNKTKTYLELNKFKILEDRSPALFNLVFA